jgi:hypothetical protein
MATAALKHLGSFGKEVALNAATNSKIQAAVNGKLKVQTHLPNSAPPFLHQINDKENFRPTPLKSPFQELSLTHTASNQLGNTLGLKSIRGGRRRKNKTRRLKRTLRRGGKKQK